MRIDNFMKAKEKCNKGLVGEDGGGGGDVEPCR
jgi:hypothetical protein